MSNSDNMSKNNSTNHEVLEIEKAQPFIIVEILEYIPNSVLIKTIIRKTTGNVSAVSFDMGEALTEKTSAFDTFIQVIDGQAEIVIDGKSHILETGSSIIIPANTKQIIKANVRFKMLSTVIKSGYDEVSLA
jgi:quercetin dioxygenase-like cupin family protein